MILAVLIYVSSVGARWSTPGGTGNLWNLVRLDFQAGT